jgi:hypothetical protein
MDYDVVIVGGSPPDPPPRRHRLRLGVPVGGMARRRHGRNPPARGRIRPRGSGATGGRTGAGGAGHDYLICDYSQLRDFNVVERLVFGAAVHDPATALHLHAFRTRSIGVSQFLAPAPLARAASVLATRRRRVAEMRPSAPAKEAGAKAC